MRWALVSLVLLAGCAPDLAPADEPSGADGSSPSDAGSGDGGAPLEGGLPDGGLPADPFEGTWSCSGNQVESCPSGGHGDSTTFTLSVSALSAAQVQSTNVDELDTTTGTDYSAYQTVLKWNVSGDSATLDGEQFTMTFPGSTGGTWAPTYQSGAWVLAARILTWKASGTAVYVNPDSEFCSFTQLFTCSPQ
jgi:hypothetical protein